MLLLARMALQGNGDFSESSDGFAWLGNQYNLNWQNAESGDGEFFRPHDGLGAELIEQAKNTPLPPVAIQFVYERSREQGQWVDVKGLIGNSGLLKVIKVSIASDAQRREQLLLLATSHHGELVHTETVERLLQLPLAQEPITISNPDESVLLNLQQTRLEDFKREVERDNETYYGEEVEKLERWSEDKRIALDLRIKQLDQEIKEARKASRQLSSLQEKMEAKKALKQLERERDNAMLHYYEEKKLIEQEEDRLLEEVEARLATETRVTELFTVTWQLVASECEAAA
jgi:hypothetical protein